MCRPAKRPKPLAVAPFVPLKAEELEMQQTLADIKPSPVAEDSEAYFSLTDLLEDAPCDLFNLPTTTPTPVNSSADAEARPKTFVYTTFDMVSNLENGAAIGFNLEGTALEIRDLVLLTEKILPKYFRHKNVTSFYRQLNSYGFRTTRSASADIAHTFTHELFRRGEPEMLVNIVRKKCMPKDKNTCKKSESPSSDLSEIVPSLVESPGSSTSSPLSSAVVSPASETAAEVSVIFQKKEVPELEELRRAEMKMKERVALLKSRNQALKDENKSILMESDLIFRTMNHLVDNQTNAIEKLFGIEAARAFAEQAKPFRFDFESESSEKSSFDAATPQIQSQAQDFTEFVDETNDILFQDDELQMLENIFNVDASSLMV